MNMKRKRRNHTSVQSPSSPTSGMDGPNATSTLGHLRKYVRRSARKSGSGSVRSHDGIGQQVWVRYILLLTICMLLVYLGFRVYSVVALGISAVARYKGHHTTAAVCPSTDSLDTNMGYTSYVKPGQKLIQKYSTNSTGQNVYKNPDLQRVETDGYPSDFERQPTVDGVELALRSDADGLRYVRSTVAKYVAGSAGTAWLPNVVEVAYGDSYHFAYTYRSDTAVAYSLQFRHADGTFTYRTTNNLPKAAAWDTVEGHFTIDDKTITAARIVVYPVAVGYVDVRGFSMYALQRHDFAQGIVSVAFDDGWRSVYTAALPLFDAYHIRTSQYVVPQFVAENDKQYMNAQQIRTLQSKGHEIGIHSYEHCNMTRQATPEIIRDTQLAKHTLADIVGRKSNGGFAYPFGAYDQQAVDVVTPQYDYVRTSDKGFNGYYTDTTRLKVQSVESNTAIEDVQSWITYAKENKQWLVLLYHRVGESGEYNIDPKVLDQHLRALTDAKLKVLTVADALKELGL